MTSEKRQNTAVNNPSRRECVLSYVGKAAFMTHWFAAYAAKFGPSATLGDVRLWLREKRGPARLR